MKLAVITNEQLKAEFLDKGLPDYANVCFVQEPQNIPTDTYLVFDLLYDGTPERVSLLKQFLPRPVFINAVTATLAAIDQPFIRINAWPTFLKRNITEVVALPEQSALVSAIFEKLGWQYTLVSDLTGMVSGRITAMIINEAYYTLQEGISTRSAIDTAMLLGTHFPYGPFEWSEKIGLKNIYTMLSVLNKENDLYELSPLLIKEAIENNQPKN